MYLFTFAIIHITDIVDRWLVIFGNSKFLIILNSIIECNTI